MTYVRCFDIINLDVGISKIGIQEPADVCVSQHENIEKTKNK